MRISNTCVLFFFCAARALTQTEDRPDDRKAIRNVVASLNEAYAHGDSAAMAKLFAASDGAPQVEDRSVWSETTPPHIEIRSIRFISRSVASVDAVESQIGHMSGRRSAVFLILRRTGGEWRIASYRRIQARAP
jgi:hypothetical protein